MQKIKTNTSRRARPGPEAPLRPTRSGPPGASFWGPGSPPPTLIRSAGHLRASMFVCFCM